MFKDLFAFSRPEISDCFNNAKLVTRAAGLKILKAQILPEHGKLLIIIPKVYGKAHKRNLLRRRLKAIFYEEKIYANKTVFIIIANKEANKLDFNSLKQIVTKYLKVT